MLTGDLAVLQGLNSVYMRLCQRIYERQEDRSAFLDQIGTERQLTPVQQ